MKLILKAEVVLTIDDNEFENVKQNDPSDWMQLFDESEISKLIVVSEDGTVIYEKDEDDL